ncbi:MAG: CAP domain-containing protein, partial [Pseudobutyrivibrio sp.]|nr:CAP domain-containing protein [Pseudobutyrivibrio sp.]
SYSEGENYVVYVPLTCNVLTASEIQTGSYLTDGQVLTNSLTDKGVKTAILFDGSEIYLKAELPKTADGKTAYSFSKANVDFGDSFNAVKMDFAVKSGKPVVKLSKTAFTQNLFGAGSQVPGLEIPLLNESGVVLDETVNCNVTKGRTDAPGIFDIALSADKKTLQVKVSDEAKTTDANLEGKYTFKVTLASNGEDLATQSFTYELTHKATVKFADGKTKSSTTVYNQWDNAGEAELVATDVDGTALTIDELNLTQTANKTTVATDCNTTPGKIQWSVEKDAAVGTNTYTVEACVTDLNGYQCKVGTLAKGFEIAVKTLPAKVNLTATKISLNPWLNQTFDLGIKENLNLSDDLELQYTITGTDKAYKTDVADSEANPLEITFTEPGKAHVGYKSGVTDFTKGTYYYKVSVSLVEKAAPETVIQTYEGIKAVNEAIEFLQKQPPVHKLELSKELSQACHEHLNDIGPKGYTTHIGSDGKHVQERIEKICEWDGAIAENLDFGFQNPENILMNFIIDDGVKERFQRKNLFNDEFNYIGIAIGPHKEYGTCAVVCYCKGIRHFGTSPNDATDYISEYIKHTLNRK